MHKGIRLYWYLISSSWNMEEWVKLISPLPEKGLWKSPDLLELNSTFSIVKTYLIERIHSNWKIAQINMYKKPLNLTVVHWWSNLVCLICFFTAFFFLFCVWLLKQPFLFDGTDSDSILFRFLATWKCFIGKIYYVNVFPKDIPSNRLKNHLI